MLLQKKADDASGENESLELCSCCLLKGRGWSGAGAGAGAEAEPMHATVEVPLHHLQPYANSNLQRLQQRLAPAEAACQH